MENADKTFSSFQPGFQVRIWTQYSWLKIRSPYWRQVRSYAPSIFVPLVCTLPRSWLFRGIVLVSEEHDHFTPPVSYLEDWHFFRMKSSMPHFIPLFFITCVLLSNIRGPWFAITISNCIISVNFALYDVGPKFPYFCCLIEQLVRSFSVWRQTSRFPVVPSNRSKLIWRTP